MTVNELADFTGKEVRTIRRWIAKAGDKIAPTPHDIMSQGRARDYDIDEVEIILNNSSLSKDAVLILMGNARQNNNVVKAPNDITGPFVAFMAQMQKQQEIFMTAVLEKLDNRSGEVVQPKQLEAPQQNFRSMLNQIVGKYAKEKTNGDRREAWGVLYEELYHRCRISVRTRANNRKMAKLDVIEEAGLLESAYLIMVEKLGE